MQIFKSLSNYKIDGNQCFAVENPTACENFNHLVGADVEIDGMVYNVEAIERFAHTPPFSAGEHIGLQVKLARPNVHQK